MGDPDVAETLGTGRGQPCRGHGTEEHVALDELLVDRLRGTGVEHRQPIVPDDAEVHVEGVDPEPLQHPVIGRQEFAGVAVEVRRTEVEQPAHGRLFHLVLVDCHQGLLCVVRALP